MTGILDERANLGGKVAAVIGGGGGIGAGVSLALARAGVDLVICDIDEQALRGTADAAAALGRTVRSVAADATDPQALGCFYRTAAEFDRLDIVVNVVGGVKRSPFMDASPKEAAADIQRNYGYVVQSVREAVPLIRRGGRGGSIVNFTTIEAHRGAAGFAVYAGAKAATANFTRAMAVELGSERIRLNCVAPDTTPSRGNMEALSSETRDAFARLPASAMSKGMEMYIPLKAPPPVEALADAVLFLASDLAAFVSGMTLHVDGGTMAAAGFLDWPFGDGFLPVPFAGTLSRMYREEDDR